MSLAAEGYRHLAVEGYFNMIHVHPMTGRTVRSMIWLMKEQSSVFKRNAPADRSVRILTAANWARKVNFIKNEDMELQQSWKVVVET